MDGSDGVSSASAFCGSGASKGSGSSSSYIFDSAVGSTVGSIGFGVAESPALSPPHDTQVCFESGLSAPHALHVQIRVSADSASRSGSFCFVLRFTDRRFMDAQLCRTRFRACNYAGTKTARCRSHR